MVSGVALILLGTIWTMPAAAVENENPHLLEQRIKAAFLFKFGGYVEWPERAFVRSDSPFIIGVAGADVLAEELLKVVTGRTMNGRKVAIRRMPGGEQIGGVHVLFIGQSESGRLGELLSMTHGLPVLTVTETAKAFEQGSIINFVVTDNRVRFEVSLDAARRNALRIGAPLLAVAQRVQEKTK